jgi:predicted nuclease of predicted toxin-antitoxin system
MGISGLTRFIETSADGVGKRMNLNSIPFDSLIIDGNSFAFYMAKQQNWLFGCKFNIDLAQYKELEKCVEFYCRELSKFTAFAVFDGSLPAYKKPNRKSRYSDRIQQQRDIINRISSNNLDDLHISSASTLLPRFSISVVMEKMKSMNIKIVIAKEEADQLIAYLAQVHNGLVLSQDSDFFIYNVPFYSPLSSLEIMDISTGAEMKKAISVKRYCSKELASYFHIRHDHLYILAVFGGSDNMPTEELLSFYKTHSYLGLNNKNNKKKWMQILIFLKRFSSVDPLAAEMKICNLLKPSWRTKMQSLFGFAKSQYEVHDGEKIKYILLENQEKCISNLIGFDRSAICQRIIFFGLNYKILEVIDGNSFWCSPSLEDCSKGRNELIKKRLGIMLCQSGSLFIGKFLQNLPLRNFINLTLRL